MSHKQDRKNPIAGDIFGGWQIIDGSRLVKRGTDIIGYRCRCVVCGKVEVKRRDSLGYRGKGCIDCRPRKGTLATDGRKKCARCLTVRPVDSYVADANKKDSLCIYCKRCQKNEGLRKFGLTVEDYEEILDGQYSRCAICGKHCSEEGSAFSVDHCHQTGKIRGLLCRTCNRALGLFGDDVSIVSRAAAYLNGYSYAQKQLVRQIRTSRVP